jgi:hypothetical protein
MSAVFVIRASVDLIILGVEIVSPLRILKYRQSLSIVKSCGAKSK